MKPGVPASTMKMETPREPLAERSVFAATNAMSPCTPLVMYILVPLSTQLSPSRRAVVRIAATSDPASGSVTATAAILRPATMSGM